MKLKWNKFNSTWAAEGLKDGIRTFYVIAYYAKSDNFDEEFFVTNPLQQWDASFRSLSSAKIFCQEKDGI